MGRGIRGRQKTRSTFLCNKQAAQELKLPLKVTGWVSVTHRKDAQLGEVTCQHFPVERKKGSAWGRQTARKHRLSPVAGWRHHFYGNCKFSPSTSVPTFLLGKESTRCILVAPKFLQVQADNPSTICIWQHKLFQPFLKAMVKCVRPSRLALSRIFHCTSTFLFIKCRNPQELKWWVKKIVILHNS